MSREDNRCHYRITWSPDGELKEKRETDREVPFFSPEAGQDLRDPSPSADEEVKAHRGDRTGSSSHSLFNGRAGV